MDRFEKSNALHWINGKVPWQVYEASTRDTGRCCNCHISSCNPLPWENMGKPDAVETSISEATRLSGCLLCRTFSLIYLSSSWLWSEERAWKSPKKKQNMAAKSTQTNRQALLRHNATLNHTLGKSPNMRAYSATPQNHSGCHCTKPWPFRQATAAELNGQCRPSVLLMSPPSTIPLVELWQIWRERAFLPRCLWLIQNLAVGVPKSCRRIAC